MNMTYPLISVIVPVYNVEKYLHKCVNSLIAQTYRNIEIILIDDGSPDSSGTIGDRYAANDKRIKVIHKENGGLVSARNAGYDTATGDWIMYVDGDDWIEPDMFHKMYQAALKEKTDVVICGANYYENNGDFIRSDLVKEKRYDQKHLIKNLYGTPNPLGGTCWNKLFRRSKIGEIRFRENLTMAEDWVYLFECFKRCDSGIQLPVALYNVVERTDSVTRKNEVQAICDIVFGGKLKLLLPKFLMM